MIKIVANIYTLEDGIGQQNNYDNKHGDGKSIFSSTSLI